jgi:hypothetical protein
MMRTAILLGVASLAGCAVDAGSDGYDVTLTGDSKADEIGGLHVRWELGDRHDWFAESDPELAVTVARRGGTLMLLDADVAELKAIKDDGTPNFKQDSVITIGVTTTAINVDLGFALVDAATLAGDRLQPLSCGGTQMFHTLAIDLPHQEVVVDGTKHVPLAECGFAFDLKDQSAFRAQTFALLGVPIRTTDGSQFAGSYRYKHTVTVR